MKAFIAAVTVLSLLLLGVVALSAAGIARVDDYLSALPSSELSPTEGLGAILSLRERVLSDLFLLNSLFPHERIDGLNAALSRVAAAAQANDEVEYQILRAELESLLLDMKRELSLQPADIV